MAVGVVVKQEECSKTQHSSVDFALDGHVHDAPAVAVTRIGKIGGITIIGCIAVLINAANDVRGNAGFSASHAREGFTHCETFFLQIALNLLPDHVGAVISPESSGRADCDVIQLICGIPGTLRLAVGRVTNGVLLSRHETPRRGSIATTGWSVKRDG